MFDLPIELAEERKEYRIFRKGLIKEGFSMIQYSVYMRVCPNKEYAKSLENKIRKIVPNGGNVRLFYITEKQYKDMVLLVGEKTDTEKYLGSERMVII